MDDQLHFRIAALECRHRLRQRVARLGVRGRNRQRADLIVGKFLAGATQVLRFSEDALGDRHHGFARLGNGDEALAVPREYLDAQLVLKGADLLRDAGLRGMQGIGRLGNVEAAAHHLGEVTQLLELHLL